MNIIFFGAPGVGKGTQAQILAERLAVTHISTGAILRAAIEAGTDSGILARSFMDAGQLVPDEVVTAIALEALGQPACEGGFLLDGYPRNCSQAEALSEYLEKNSRRVDRVVYLTAPLDELVVRMLKRGRADDTEEVIRARFVVYDNETSPVLQYYRDRDLVTEVNGVGEIEEVHNRILSAIGASTDGVPVE